MMLGLYWKKLLARAFSLSVAAFLTLAFSVGTTQDSTRIVRVGVYQNKPKVFITESGLPGGIFVEILVAIAEREGWTLEYMPCEWMACLESLENGRIDLMPDVAFSPERDVMFDFHTIPVLESWSRIYVPADAAISRMSELNGKRVAVLQGSIQQTAFAQMMEGFGYSVTIIPTDSLDQAFSLAADGSADAAIANYFYGDYFSSDYGLQRTTIDFNPVTLYFATAEGRNQDLLTAVDRYIGEWKQQANSAYYQAINRWTEKEPEFRVPQYYYWIAGGILGLLVFAGGMVLLLRQQVRIRTKRLAQAKAKLQRSEERFRRLAENAQDLIFRYEFTPKRGFAYVSPSSTAITGYTPEEHYADPDLGFKLVHPDDRPLLEAASSGDTTPGQPITLRWVRKDGKIIWTEQRNVSILDEAGELTAIEGIARDITERKQTDEMLQENERRLSTIYDNIHDVLFYMAVEPDDSFRFLSINKAFLQVTGLSEEQIAGKHYHEVIPKPAQAMVLAHYKEAVRTKAVVNWEEVSEYPAGKKYGEVSVAPVFDANGKCTHLIGTVHDITDRVRVLAALGESQRRMQCLFETTQDAILFMDDDGRCVDANPAACALLDSSREQLIQMTIWDITPPPNLELGRKQWRAFLDSGRQAGEYTLSRRNGTTVETDYRAVANILPGLHLSVMRDITERKQHEREREAIIIMANALRTAPTRADMLPVILDQLMEILSADGAALVMRDPISEESHVELARGEFMLDPSVHMPRGEGVSGYVIETGESFLSNDLQNEPRFTNPEVYATIRAAACLPLIAQGQTIGALWMGRKSDIAPAEVRLLSAIADMAANAIYRSSLHEQTTRQVQRLAALHAIDTAISSSMDLRVTLSILLAQVTDQLGVDAAAILLLNRQKQTLEFSAGRGFQSDAIERSVVRLGEGYAGMAAVERHVVQIPNLAEGEITFTRAALLAKEKFVTYAAAPLVAKGQVKGVLEIFHRYPIHAESDWLSFLETLAEQAAIAIDDAGLFEGLQRSNIELSIAYDATIEGLSRALDIRDRETEGHSRRVMEMTVHLANAASLNPADMIHVRRGVLLHDIGKLGVPDGILLKPGPLTDEEWVIMRRHPQLAFEMLSPIKYLNPALDIPYCHHERWDGKGYPRGLKGEDIPFSARLFAVVDVWDALLSDRPYRTGWPEKRVVDHIQSESGTHFDPQAVELFMRVLKAERKEE
jgi:PAS domain S-box-containing protein